MKLTRTVLSVVMAVVVSFAFAGCGKTGSKTSSKTDNKTGAHPAHPSEGLHGGHLVELGEEEFHAEVVHDEKNDSITIYILDSGAKKQVPVDATEVVITLKHGGAPEQFKLLAVPDTNDGQGKSSRFQLKDKDLVHDLEHENAEPKLSVKISGKSYTGEIKHNHKEGDHKH